MDDKKRWLTKKRMAILAFFAGFCLAIIALGALQPPRETMLSMIPAEFKEDAGTRYAQADFNYGAFRVLRGTNLRNAEKMTYIGFAGKIFKVEKGGLKGTLMDMLFWLPALLNGTRITISLTIVSVGAGLIGSIFLALGKISRFKILKSVCSAYIFFFRGTPLLMQLYFVYYALPEISPALTIKNKFLAAFIAFGLNSAAYCAEIIRAAIQSIDKGQFEAAHTLGHSYWQSMGLIVLPQAIRRLIPPVANEFIMVLKDASLVSIISLIDLTHATRSISSSNSTAIVYIPAMAIYLLITAFFSYVFNKLEKKYSVYQ